jgi:subtilase family serine protease
MFDSVALPAAVRRHLITFVALAFAASPLVAQVELSRSQLAHRTMLNQAIAASRPAGELPRASRLNLSIGLPLRNQDQLDALLADLSDPTSPRYHHYLTPDEFAAQFGPTEQDYQAVIEFAQAHHLEITATHANRAVLSVSGAAPDIESAFQVKLGVYQHPTRGQFFTADHEPSLPTGAQIQDVAGLDNFVIPQPMDLHITPLNAGATALTATGSGPGNLFIGTDFRNAYAPGVTLTGTGQSIGLLEFDGFFSGDVTKNFAAAKLPATTVSTVLLDGLSGSAGSNNTEVILDIMMAAYMAPGATKIVVYEGSQPNDILNRMATDGIAQLSSSWGFGGVNATTENIFKQYAAQGQTLFQAAGDSGGYTGAIQTPSDDPALTVVGGTALTTNGAGGTWLSETTWSGSGGGVSTTWPIPTWQTGMNLSARGGSNTRRNIPDVALTGAVQIYLICNNGQAISVGGTSAATPLWAGFLALANQQAVAAKKGTLGFLNPVLYTIGNSGTYATAFHDITTGSNGAFKALAGYDLTTGWGTPAGQPLINALTSTTPAQSFTLATSATTALTVGRPGTAGTTVTITPVNGFSGAVALTATGLPTGVTAAFSPASATTTSTLTFTGSSTATPGTYTITITGTAASLKETTTVSITVPTPTFTLATASSALSINTGKFASTTITPTAVNSFTGTITYTASGLPTGVTAAFSPTSAAVGTPTTLTLTIAATAKAGTYTVNVTGTSGPTVITTPITLTVVAPTFTLASGASSLTLIAGKTVSTTITPTPVSGFTGTIAYSATNLPAGVTATFSPASTAQGTPTTLTLTAAPTAKAATATISIMGTSGVLAVSTPINLSVVVPGFTLTAGTSTINIASKPSSGTSSIISAGTNGFSGTIAYTATGLPSGVTATFSPASAGVGTSTTLTLTAASTAAAGTHTITITGTSGNVTATTMVTLTIATPSFTLAFSPNSLSIKRGATANTTLTVTAAPTFSGTVSLTPSGLPTGMTLNPIASSGASLTLQASPSTAVKDGTYTITITGTSPNTTSATATLTVTVTN